MPPPVQGSLSQPRPEGMRWDLYQSILLSANSNLYVHQNIDHVCRVGDASGSQYPRPCTTLGVPCPGLSQCELSPLCSPAADTGGTSEQFVRAAGRRTPCFCFTCMRVSGGGVCVRVCVCVRARVCVWDVSTHATFFLSFFCFFLSPAPASSCNPPPRPHIHKLPH